MSTIIFCLVTAIFSVAIMLLIYGVCELWGRLNPTWAARLADTLAFAVSVFFATLGAHYVINLF